MRRPLPLIGFDQSPISRGRGGAAAIRDTLHLAMACEALGYHRFWVAEHHLNASIANPAGEILAAAIAARTSRIRVGVAAVLLPFYEPFKVAEQFKVLSALAPGRIDLGLARAPRADPRLAGRIYKNADISHAGFMAKIEHLRAWLENAPARFDASFHSSEAMPDDAVRLEVWVMASSLEGAKIAAMCGLPMCFNYSSAQRGDDPRDAMQAYRQGFKPASAGGVSCAAVMVWALSADSEDEARHLYSSRRLWRARLARGVREPLLSPNEAAVILRSEHDEDGNKQTSDREIVGDVATVTQKLSALVEELQVDELGLTAWTFDPADRLRSFAGIISALCGPAYACDRSS